MKGLPHRTRADLVLAMFSDGVSTAEAVTELAGRGVGISAVAEVVQAMGGLIEVHSLPAEGTRFSVIVPLHAAPSTQRAAIGA